MSHLQKVTLSSFLEVVGKKTLNDYSEMTGIERTRLFRLLHGAEMKLNEFETFQSFLLKNDAEVVDWKNVISMKNFKERSREERIDQDLALQMERAERLNLFLNNLEGNIA